MRIHWKTYIKYWKNKELQDLTVIEAVKKIIEMEARNGNKRK